ncbi:MAG: nucleotidyl transferase AbiEii/AbiGii toxin family protein [Thermotogaceae bacterium]|nr:nucleotidyl transferase AbiEii/AbiGii toxin family protein [Thermotogaceae bacterium]
MQQPLQDFSHLKEWFKLPDETKLRIFTETGRSRGLLPFAVEKDWWVVHTLAVIYNMDCAGSIVFKGGTSLSKGWDLIQRFSEDIDLALDREYLGFSGELENADVRRLRRKSYEYLTEKFTPELQVKFAEVGFTNVTIKYKEVPNHDQDPMVIEVYYPKLTEEDTYLKPGVLVEVGSRSLKEPFTERTFATIVAENYPGQPFTDKPITIPTVNPERTFLEKIFLLHEEFQKLPGKRRVDGLSRHLYDIEILSRTDYADIALNNPDLFDTIVAHRSKFSRISGVDFANHSPDKIAFIPPEHVLPDWETDYNEMKENMIYGEALPFSELIEKLEVLQSHLNRIK